MIKEWIKLILKYIPDRLYLKLLYRIKMGCGLNLENPQSFNAKLQWLKLYDREKKYTNMVDKFEAKKYVADLIGEEHIIPTLGVWDKFEDVDFDKLPSQFVLKCTHDSGGLVICRNKSNFNVDKAREILNKSLNRNYFWVGREWPYKNVKPRIIAEKYMEENDKSEKSLTDYKFYCFNGEIKCLYVSHGLDDHSTARISFLSSDWEFAKFNRSDYQAFEVLPEKPKKYEEMLNIAKILSKGIAFLRVDLYEINGNIYFSELTFHPCSGFMPFYPKEWDYVLGKWLQLPEKEC